MSAYLDVFMPAFGLLALGAGLRRWLLREDTIWAGIERLVFWVLMPALLVSAIAPLRLSELPLGGMALSIWLALAIGTGLGLLLARLFGLGHPAMTSVVQGGIRFNNLMGFAIIGPLAGSGGTAMGAVATGLIVPCVQVLTTLVFALGPGTDGRRPSPWRAAWQLAVNPLLLACLTGFIVAALGGLPPGLNPLLRSLGQASIALGLLCVGAALSLDTLRRLPVLQLVVCVQKLLVMPLLTLAIAGTFGLSGLPLGAAVVFMALPTATTSYVMSRVMGGDAPLMAALITTEHLLAVITLPLWIAGLGLGAR